MFPLTCGSKGKMKEGVWRTHRDPGHVPPASLPAVGSGWLAGEGAPLSTLQVEALSPLGMAGASRAFRGPFHLW